jgi:uroporphyrinogen-III synthase
VRLLIIRPQPGSDATAIRATQLGMNADVIPLFEVEAMPWSVPNTGGYDALMLTSANALRHGGAGLAQLTSLPVYAVGQATATAARAAGFDVVWTGKSGADAAAAQAGQDGRARILRLAGEQHSIVSGPAGSVADIIVTYRNAALAAPARMFQDDSLPFTVMLHSVRAARHFAAACAMHLADISRIHIAALSPQIASAAGFGWAGTIIADMPDDEALLSKAKSYFTNLSRDP